MFTSISSFKKMIALFFNPVDLFDLITGRTEIVRNAKITVNTLANEIGPRSFNHYESLTRAKKYIFDRLIEMGAKPYEETYQVKDKEIANILVDIPGTIHATKILLIGAHYDTVDDSRGANDNASGVTALLELYRLISKQPVKRTIRIAFFALEEPPYFATEFMGSMVNARRAAKRRDTIELMLCIDMIGYGGTFVKQSYPTDEMKRIYPERGNFVIVAALPSCAKHAFLCKKIFNHNSKVAAHEIIAPASINGINSSDHYSFNKTGFPSIMISDTGFYRNKNYHTETDTIDTINFRFMAENIYGIFRLVKELSGLKQIP